MQIEFEKHVLSNGLSILAHRDPLTPMVCVNVMYKVGARNENPERTGFAHLFEHLMFGGSKNIPQYDRYVDMVGGENNAFTNADITNYYLTVPATALDTALWLESDRMLALAFSEESLMIQKSVVVEEFKQRYLNQPYGDVWLLLRPLAYQVHPYSWPAIGKDPKHIEEASLQEVMAFFHKYYTPGNAILSIAGNIDPMHAIKRAEHWFANIPTKPGLAKDWKDEPTQVQDRHLEVSRNVPANAWYRAYHMEGRNQDGYYAADLLSDILSGGYSSRFYSRLMKEKALFSEISTFVTGDLDPGLFVINGKISDQVSPDLALDAVETELQKILNEKITERELEKVKNKVESTILFSSLHLTEKALNLAYHEVMGHAGEINKQIEHYRSVTREDILTAAGRIFRPGNSASLAYYKNA